MPAMMNLNEAKAKFSSVVDYVMNDNATVTILRYGSPVARIVPVAVHRTTTTCDELSGSISAQDLFSDESSEWESA